MARNPRKVIPETPHHVVMRGNNRRKLFSYEHERATFVSLMIHAEPRCAVHALCLMSNHVHLIATPTAERDLGRFVKSFAQRYAQQRNRRRRASGKLFEERFWSKPICDPTYMAIATAYVDDNARTANLTRTDDFPWSTYALHAGVGAAHVRVQQLWTPSQWYLALGENALERATAYSDWSARYRDHVEWRSATNDIPARYSLSADRRPNRSKVL